MKRLLFFGLTVLIFVPLNQNYAQTLDIKCEVMHGTPFSPPTLFFVQGEALDLGKVELKGKWEGADSPTPAEATTWFSNTSGDNPLAPLDWTDVTFDDTWVDDGSGNSSIKKDLKNKYENSAWKDVAIPNGWMAENSIYMVEFQTVVGGTATPLQTFTFDPSGTVDFEKAEYKIKYEGKREGATQTEGGAESMLKFEKGNTQLTLPAGTEFLRVSWKNPSGTFYTADFPVTIVTASDLGLNIAITPESYPAAGFFAAGDVIDVDVAFTNDGATALNWNEASTNGLEKFEFFFSGPKQDYVYVYNKVKVIDKFNLKNNPDGNPYSNPIQLVVPDPIPGAGSYTLLVKAKRVYGTTTEKIVMKDMQIGSADLTELPVGNCGTCHADNFELSEHGAVGFEECLVCHVDELGEYGFSNLVHSRHMTSPHYSGGLADCSACHLNDSQDQFTSDAEMVCISCHNPTPFFPSDHSATVPLYAEEGMSCSTTNCHSGGGSDNFTTIKATHEKVNSKCQGGTLVALQTTTVPQLDGVAGNEWDNAIGITTSEGVTIKAQYDNDNVYFLTQWTDGHILKAYPDAGPTESVDKNQWSHDGSSWGKTGNEDRFAFMFAADDSFEASCAQMCHSDATHKTSDGNVDVWHWKAARTNPIGLADDKWWDNSGRGSDAKTISAYHDNKSDAGDSPQYSGPISDEHFLIVPDGQTDGIFTVFDPSNAALQSNTYPGYYLDANAYSSGESRHDVLAGGKYNDGVWTVEFQRALNTGNEDDAVFAFNSETKFTTAKFDNTGGGHASQGIDICQYTLKIGGGSTVGVDDINDGLPGEYSLGQNYPNPFNPVTTIKYNIIETGHVTIAIFNALGQEVMKVVNQQMNPGFH